MEIANNLKEKGEHLLTEKQINHQIKLAVEKVSYSGSYQKKLILLLMAISLFNSLMTIGSPFLYMNPVFQCQGIEGTVNQEVACKRIDSCTLKNDFTLTSQMDLICGSKKEVRNLIQTVTGLGSWPGIFLAGIIGDWKGKKLGLIISLGLAAFSAFLRILGGELQSIVLLLICETLTGISYKGITMISFIMMTRFLTVQHYELASITWYIAGGGIGQIIIAIFNTFFPSWLNFSFTLFIPLFLLFLVAIFLLEEDPIFLFGSQRYQQCKDVIKRVGERNNASADDLTQANLMIHEMEIAVNAVPQPNNISVDPSIHHPHAAPKLELKVSCRLIFFILSLGCCGLCSNLTYTSLQYGVQSLGSSYSVNLVMIGIAEIAGYFTMTILIRRDINRRMGVIYSSIIYCILGLLFMFPFCTRSPTIENVLVFLLRYFGCWIYSFFARIKVDSFPEKLQTSLLGLIQLLSNIGKIIGPTMVQISSDHSVNPIVTSNFIRMLIGTIPFCFINEKMLTDPQTEIEGINVKTLK